MRTISSLQQQRNGATVCEAGRTSQCGNFDLNNSAVSKSSESAILSHHIWSERADYGANIFRVFRIFRGNLRGGLSFPTQKAEAVFQGYL